MYVVKFGKGKNVYVRLMEGYRDSQGRPRNRVVQNLGRYDDLIKDDPDAFEKLKAQYRVKGQVKKQATQQARQTEIARVLALQSDNCTSTAPLPLLSYGHYVLKQIWDEDLALGRKISYLQKTQTNIQFDVNAAISFMSFMKVLDPCSVLGSLSDKDNFIGDPAAEITLDDFYHSLSFLKQYKDDLMQWVNRQMDKKFGKSRASMVFYDVTNAYFESAMTDAERGYEQVDFVENVAEMARIARENNELDDSCFDEDGNVIAEALPPEFIEAIADEKIQYLRMRGPSKEHRFDLPIVSLALVIDSNGFPMDFAVYAGNDSEFKTMRKSIEFFKRKYDIENVTVSADRGINSVRNLQMLQDLGFGFLVAQKVSQFSESLNKRMLNRDLYTPFDPADPEAGGYQVIKDWTKTGSRKNEKVQCTLVLTYNEKRRRRDEALLNVLRSIIEKKIAKGEKIGPRKTGWAGLAKVADDKEQMILGVDEELFEKRRRLCGYAALVYAEPRQQDAAQESAGQQFQEPNIPILSGEQIAHAYRRQSRIEECFRIMKHNLGLRPMYVRNSDHVRGHVTVCVLALLLVRLLQHKLDERGIAMSINDICRTLKNASVAVLKTTSAEGQEDASFLSCERRASLRKGRERMSTEDLLQELAKDRIKAHGIADLMQAVGLEPLPQACSRHELARCLRTRFGSPMEAVPPLCWHGI